MAVGFAPESINKNKVSACRRLEYSVLKCRWIYIKSYLLILSQSVDGRWFHTIKACSDFDLIKTICNKTSVFKEEKL
jgi:hypothetical protein